MQRTSKVEQEVVEGGGDAGRHFAQQPGRSDLSRAAADDAEIAPGHQQIAAQLVCCTTHTKSHSCLGQIPSRLDCPVQ